MHGSHEQRYNSVEGVLMKNMTHMDPQMQMRMANNFVSLGKYDSIPDDVFKKVCNLWRRTKRDLEHLKTFGPEFRASYFKAADILKKLEHVERIRRL